MIMPKSKDSGIMVLDLIDRNGYLNLSDEEFSKKDSRIKQYARVRMEYGESHEGYWNSSKFMKQIEEASKIASILLKE